MAISTGVPVAIVGVLKAVRIPVLALMAYIDTVPLSALVTYAYCPLQVTVILLTFALATVPIPLLTEQVRPMGCVPMVTE